MSQLKEKRTEKKATSNLKDWGHLSRWIKVLEISTTNNLLSLTHEFVRQLEQTYRLLCGPCMSF